MQHVVDNYVVRLHAGSIHSVSTSCKMCWAQYVFVWCVCVCVCMCVVSADTCIYRSCNEYRTMYCCFGFSMHLHWNKFLQDLEQCSRFHTTQPIQKEWTALNCRDKDS